MLPTLKGRASIWAMKIAATASYSAVPSMLMVAPIGKTNLDTLGSTPFLSSKQPIVIGKVAELIMINTNVLSKTETSHWIFTPDNDIRFHYLEAVPKAVARACVMFMINLNGNCLVTTPYMKGRTTNPWMKRPSKTVIKYIPNFSRICPMSLASRSWAAIRKHTPTGESLQNISDT